ncbi:hypothetical protein L3Q82_005918 [Scortum barcoo]|uniref:Uncharacterized protein n=1 Tax=Scortum barcoo TaxID=214431 RepID=A0ACB8V6V1_9TELE|nr:hypothetical protein L3Q82_005918 [Scortum barcoo]
MSWTLWVKRGAELSTDHHLVVSWLRWQRRKLDRPGRPERITEKGGVPSPGSIESILTGCITAWYSSCTALNRKALQGLVKAAQHITRMELPSMEDLYTQRCRRRVTLKIIKDPSHSSHKLFCLLAVWPTVLQHLSPNHQAQGQLHTLTNSISVLENNLGEIKRDVVANEQHIEEAEACIAATEEALDRTEMALSAATKRLTHLEQKTEDLENRGRRKNIRLFGLKEGADGTRPLLDFINDMLRQWLNTGPDRTFTLERVHRTLAPAIPNQTQAVLICFLRYQDKEFVLRSTRQRDITHDETKLAFAQDFSAETIR